MADPISIIGAIGAIANIIDVVAKTVSTIRQLHNRWKESDFILINIISQLVALKATLTKIQEWLETDVDPYHQLVMDLELSLSCCKMLVTRLDGEVLAVCRTSDWMDNKGKIELLIKHGTLEELQKMVERQSIGLSLLLTACNCKAISDQKTILERQSSRKILHRIKDDTSSLYVHPGSSSQQSRLSGWSRSSSNLSKISRVFEFDGMLFSTKVYERALRRSMKSIAKAPHITQLHHPTMEIGPTLTTEEVAQLKQSRRLLKRDYKEFRKMQVRILLFGDPGSGKELLDLLATGDVPMQTAGEIQHYAYLIRKNMSAIIDVMVMVLKAEWETLDETLKTFARDYSRTLFQIVERTHSTDEDILKSTEVTLAVQRLWGNEDLRQLLLKSSQWVALDSPEYFIERINIIADNNYLPNDMDIVRCSSDPEAKGLRETKITMQIAHQKRFLNILDISGLQKAHTQWPQAFKNRLGLICVDLCAYDTKFQEAIELFDAVVNSGWYQLTKVMVFFCKITHFKEKVLKFPLSGYFPEYKAGNDVANATEYLLGRFAQRNTRKLDVCSHILERKDGPVRAFVAREVADSIILESISLGGFT